MATTANANVTGKIAIRGLDGKYMRVTPSHGLEFGIQKLEDAAKFDVQKHGDKVGLKGTMRVSSPHLSPSFLTPFFLLSRLPSIPRSLTSLTGSNAKFVNMYYIDDVKCDGPEGGVSMGVVYLAQGQINFTITGYQGQGGRTRFLSSEAGNASYNGSLAVKEFEDVTCRFTIQNL